MIDSIQTFGDSFLFGSDLSDCDNITNYSYKTWPALIAKELKLDYVCHAESGRGNQSIAFKVFRSASKTSLNIINWSWVDRFDYHFDWKSGGGWPYTIRPDDSELSTFYYKNIHTEYDDKVKNLTIIHSALSYLKNNNMPFIMTYMDHLITDEIIGIDHVRKEVNNNLQTFPNNQTFLEWSRANNYLESDNWHPLEQAHEEAAKYWQPIYEKAINTHIT